MALTLTQLIERTRALAGDPKFQDNTLTWSDLEIIDALNWAQNRYVEATQCTYAEADAVQADSKGLILNPTGHLKVVAVRTADTDPTEPVAAITAPATAAKGSTIGASVPAQAGAGIFWMAAGGWIVSGQGTAAVQVQAMDQAGRMTLGVSVALNGLEASSTAEVTLS